MNPQARQFTIPTLVQVAGVNAVTFRAWRNRNGLFPETVDHQKGWKRFSFVDICIVRVIVVLTSHGIAPSDAIWPAEQFLRTAITVAASSPGTMSPILGFGKDAAGRAWYLPYMEEAEHVGELVRREGTITLLNLADVLSHVRNALGVGV
jgi:hypothetical protein